MLLNYLLALLSGVLLVLIHPRVEAWFLAPIAIAPLVYALAREWVPKHRFLLGYVTGLAFWSGINYWIEAVISYYGQLGHVAGVVVFILFCLLKAVPLGFFGLLGGILIQRPQALLGIPALWTGIERIPSWFSYTWLTLGNAGIDLIIPMRLAPYTGVYGLSFIFAFLGTGVALAMLRRPRRELLWMSPVLLLYMLPSLPAPQLGTNSAVTLQPSIAERPDWTAEQVTSLHRKLEYLTLQSALAANLPPPNLILWPEVPAPVYYFDDETLRARLRNTAVLARVPIVMGTVARAPDGAPLNSALYLAAGGELQGQYDKIHLVPFGEYVPWPFNGLTRKITNEVGDFQPGSKLVVFPNKAGVFICYESAFPHQVRELAKAGAEVFANLSNDGYFFKTAAREQHLSLVRMRAAENRRWVLRSTNDGITAAIDPAGRVAERYPAFTELAGRLRYSDISDKTFYTEHGDVFAWSCLGLALVMVALSQLPNFSRGG